MTGTGAAERRDEAGGETIEGLFQPDILAPAQYFDGLMKEQARAPERDLALAMLEDAVMCFQKYLKSTREKEQYLFTETEEWFRSDNREWVFSFLNLCDFLGLDPEFVRKGIFRWKNGALSGQDVINSKVASVNNDTSNEKPESPHQRQARSAGAALAVIQKRRGL